MRLSRSWTLAAAAALSVMAALWAAFGVSLGECARYLIYMALWIVLPGALLYRVLRGPGSFGLEHICIGIPLGFAQMVLGFILFSILKMRMMIPVFPWISAAACLGYMRKNREVPRLAGGEPRSSALCAEVVAALCCVSMALIALHEFPSHPLPGREAFAAADYADDLAWHMGNAAALKYSWPPKDFRVAGEALRYCIGDHIQAAADARVTGLEISAIMLRLDPLFLLGLLCLQLFWIGRRLSGDWRCGALTAFLGLLCGDLSVLWHSGGTLFFNSFIPDLYLSPSFLFGLILFIPVSVLMGECLEAEFAASRDLWPVIGLLLAACALAKATIIPVLIAALAGFILLGFLRSSGGGCGKAWVLLAASVVAAWTTAPLVVAPGSSEVLRIHPLEILRLGPAWRLLRVESLGLSPLGYLARAAIVLLGHAPAALLGFAAFLFGRRERRGAFELWMLMAALAGVPAALLTSAPGSSQLYFWFYSYVPFIALSSLGLRWLFTGAGARKAAAALACCLMFLGTLSAWARPGSEGPVDPPNEVARALLWVRAHTSPGEVLAVNNARYFYYSGFSERPVFLENFIYTPAYRRALARGDALPYLDRRRLSYYVFARGDSAAIRAAWAQFHVGYLLVDKRNGFPRHAFDEKAARLIFTNQGMDVYRVVASSS